jgi:hypothetical protein
MVVGPSQWLCIRQASRQSKSSHDGRFQRLFDQDTWLARQLSGEDLPLQPRTGAAVPDPQRHFATVNYRIAKGLFDNLVGGGKQGLRNG